MANVFHFHDENALIQRLCKGLKIRDREVVFLLGAPLSAPIKPGEKGVPGVDGVIDLIRSEFSDDPAEISTLGDQIERAGSRRYQEAFLFLQGRRGQQAVNDVVRKAVIGARIPKLIATAGCDDLFPTTEDECRFLEADLAGWLLNPGTEHLAKLITQYPNRFGRSILTTNFDPLFEVAIRRIGGSYYRTTLHADGNLGQTEGVGCHVIHLHGYWYGSDTLHTPGQLAQARPRLRASLASILRNKLVVVIAYSGWDDAFTETLMDVVHDDSAYPEIIWTFNHSAPSIPERLAERLQPGIDRGRVTLYTGVDCNLFFPKLYESWTALEPVAPATRQIQSNRVKVSESLRYQIESQAGSPTLLHGEEADRPPVVDICLGRDQELQQLCSSSSKAVFLTGFGGLGKSTLAARYFAEAQRRKEFSLYVWRDCKEEGERFENQLAAVIEKLSAGRVLADELAKQSTKAVIQVLTNMIEGLPVLFIFDNADHYVDLENSCMSGSAHIFIKALLQSNSPSRALFTCRPFVSYDDPLALSQRLQGLDLEPAIQLFSQRRATATVHEIEAAHRLTDGHAFWLDLLAIQTAKANPGTTLASLINEVSSGRGLLPEKTLKSIWTTLKPREQLILRALAETVKPVTEDELSDYLRHEIGYNKVMKGLAALKALNLVVVKRLPPAPDVMELHPLVREFVRRNFTPIERRFFIEAIIKVYQRFMGSHRAELLKRPPLSILQYWTQNAELDVEAGRFAEALSTLAEVGMAFLASAYPREFCRVARLVLTRVDWIRHHHKLREFEPVFWNYLRLLSYLGEYKEADNLLDQYATTFAAKDSRYINYCEMRCFTYWARGNFSAAMEWGQKGQDLEQSTVDTSFRVEFSLALALRDAGHPESALPIFLKGRQLRDVLDPNNTYDYSRGGFDGSGVYYGNIGRCLYFMGQIDSALICYQKSAILIEQKTSIEHVLNQGFIRYWIGEILLAREEFILAGTFLRAAYLKWREVCPPRASQVEIFYTRARSRISAAPYPEDLDVEKICVDWIVGRSTDSTIAKADVKGSD